MIIVKVHKNDEAILLFSYLLNSTEPCAIYFMGESKKAQD